ncbi:MMPL family transporter [Cohnella herbarum]|uniref:MMPL family transporter n=1 Tax=Cohnella herbarum TaxID=2728023 RepID=A0A7Z2VQX8_9BACL|nr:MMPL family transporter [Cohnella herbarum]QJD87541.1 MMPL family transporter [Cohnella herbarum]
MEKWIGWIAKLRWAIVAVWLALAALSFFVLPDLQSIVRQTEQKFLPVDAESVQAVRLLQEINPSSHSLSSAVIVLHRQGSLNDTDKRWMEELLERIQSSKQEFMISSVISTRTNPELAERMLSKDGSTLLAIVNFPFADFEDSTKISLAKIKPMLREAPSGTTAILTGSAQLSQDFQQSSENGLRRTEIITIGLVLVILLFVFRSPITPIIPLLTIGISFIIARGLVGWTAQFGMPVSHFTESFLIAVLFGAGTDYCILIIQRYREELRSDNGEALPAAISRMMRGVGKTILFSASTVLTAFLLIGFADFGLYRSAVGVAIGMLVTVAAALTLTPALLLVFGKASFWPNRHGAAHKREESRMWAKLATLAAKRSTLVLLSTTILLAPLALLFQGQRSFDDISEMDPKLESIVGFRQIERAFSAGEAFPVTIAVSAAQSMRTKSGLAALEQASSDLARADNVLEVRSAVRPLGRKPDQMTVPGQLRTPNVDEIIQTIMKEQRFLSEGLEAIALGALPFSQGLLGILPSIGRLGDGIGKLLVSPLGGFARVSDSAGSKTTDADRQALDYYISPDGKTTKFELILKPYPYSGLAMDSVPVIAGQLRASLASTYLTDTKAYVTGVSAKYNELRDISYHDFVRTGLFVLAGIAVVLILLLRSVLAPICVMLSLGFNYLITMGITEFVFVDMLGYPGLSWTVSFFIFLIIVALGVDYSIFLMARFKEEVRPGEVRSAMTKAMKTTGGIITSAAIIMAGTFGALCFSGVVTLVQIGLGTLFGLLLYATLFMGLIVPAFTFLLGEKNGWPFKAKTNRKLP